MRYKQLMLEDAMYPLDEEEAAARSTGWWCESANQKQEREQQEGVDSKAGTGSSRAGS